MYFHSLTYFTGFDSAAAHVQYWKHQYSCSWYIRPHYYRTCSTYIYQGDLEISPMDHNMKVIAVCGGYYIAIAEISLYINILYAIYMYSYLL